MTSTLVANWPPVSYEQWPATCDTLHSHTQVLGKLAVELAPSEPELQHAALRLTARGWETSALPAPDGSGALVVALDLRRHEVVIEHTSGDGEQIPLTPHRAVREVTHDVLAAVGRLVGPVEINPTPQEVPWTVPLDEDDEHAHYDPRQVAAYFDAAIRAAQVLTKFRAPFRGRSTPVAAWWGAFDLCVNLFSGKPLEPPSGDFIVRNSADAEVITVGWWPGDVRYPRAAFFGYAHPPPEGMAKAAVSPDAAHFDRELGEFILDWDDVRATPDPHANALQFANSVFRHASALGSWGETLTGSMEGAPPPLRPRRGRP
jgi:hypothetical protein